MRRCSRIIGALAEGGCHLGNNGRAGARLPTYYTKAGRTAGRVRAPTGEERVGLFNTTLSTAAHIVSMALSSCHSPM